MKLHQCKLEVTEGAEHQKSRPRAIEKAKFRQVATPILGGGPRAQETTSTQLEGFPEDCHQASHFLEPFGRLTASHGSNYLYANCEIAIGWLGSNAVSPQSFAHYRFTNGGLAALNW